MGQMADGGHHLVVLPVVQHHGDGADGLGHGHNAPYISGCSSDGREPFAALGRRHDIVGIFQQMVGGVFIARLFRAGHGMAAHETVLQALAR